MVHLAFDLVIPVTCTLQGSPNVSQQPYLWPSEDFSWLTLPTDSHWRGPDTDFSGDPCASLTKKSLTSPSSDIMYLTRGDAVDSPLRFTLSSNGPRSALTFNLSSETSSFSRPFKTH